MCIARFGKPFELGSKPSRSTPPMSSTQSVATNSMPCALPPSTCAISCRHVRRSTSMPCRSRCARHVPSRRCSVTFMTVMCGPLPQFLEEESQRTLVYFGHLEPFAPLVPGILALQHNRQHYRMQRYQEFVTFWHQVQEQG